MVSDAEQWAEDEYAEYVERNEPCVQCCYHFEVNVDVCCRCDGRASECHGEAGQCFPLFMGHHRLDCPARWKREDDE